MCLHMYACVDMCVCVCAYDEMSLLPHDVSSRNIHAGSEEITHICLHTHTSTDTEKMPEGGTVTKAKALSLALSLSFSRSHTHTHTSEHSPAG